MYKFLVLTLKRGPGSVLLVEPPRVLVRLPFRGLTQIFVESRSPLVDMFKISPEKVGLAGMMGERQHTL